MSTMMRFSNDDMSTRLSMEELRKVCPMAFAEQPTREVSNKYMQANTRTIIDDLEKLGWYPVDAKQNRPKKNKDGETINNGRSFHMIVFQNPDVKLERVREDGSKVVECYPRIILTNSHDGCNAFRFAIGFLRLACSNGLVTMEESMADERLVHVNYTFEELRELVHKSIDKVNAQYKVIDKMMKRQLTLKERMLLAENAIRVRKNLDEKIAVPQADIKNILEPHREEDAGNSLWQVFNTIQEYAIKGGNMSTNNKGNVRKMRRITSITRDIDINKKLFNEATKFIEDAVVVE